MKNSRIINRRSFLKLGTVGGLSTILPSSIAGKELEYQASKMTYRTLGNTGLKLSVLSLGPIRTTSVAMLKAAFKAGVNHFDSAHQYREGQTDILLGGLIKSGDLPREKIIVSTKVKMKGTFDDETYNRVFIESFEESLKRLTVDYVDILYLHQADTVEEVLDPRAIKALRKIKESGKAKHVGVSIHGYEPDTLKAVIDSNFYEVAMMYYNYKQKDADLISQRIEEAAKKGIGIIAMKVMAGAKGVDAALAMKWALQNRHIASALMGCTTFDEYEVDLAAAINLKMSKEEHQQLQSITANDMIYCQQCQQCTEQCPKGLKIPDLMRAYMYMYGYNSPCEAQKVIFETGTASNACGDCSQCNVVCTAGFDVAQKITDISRLADIPREFLT